MKKQIIFIDPGHGGRDSGAIGGKFEEKDLNLEISMALFKAAEKEFSATSTRTSDVFLRLQERARLANVAKADVFVCIHCNSAANLAASGIETLYCAGSRRGREFAEKVQEALIKETSATNRGVKSASFTVLRRTNMPAILVECGFISNAEERAKLADPKYQAVIVKGILAGIRAYFNTK